MDVVDKYADDPRCDIVPAIETGSRVAACGFASRKTTMYKALLCWHYLRTRFLAFVCIVSVMLGVATLVVVNSVMAGFSGKLKDRFHGLMSDVVIESPGDNGFEMDADTMMAKINGSPAARHI